MKEPPILKNEQARLDAVRALNVLDTPPEERFDRLTRMAKRIFDVPIALVTLVDENRQWFKSCFGLEITETSRNISFCGHAILGDDLFIIADALLDERFFDNPVVTHEPFVRFYAGCPLKSPEGLKLGTLCIIDSRPREFASEDYQLLIDLAVMVEREFEAIQLATLDELTAISNRRGFKQLAQYSLHFCERENRPVTLVFIDLNNFKPINDQFGHAEGDVALKTFAEQLKLTFRNSDIVARLGGDEFAVLLTNSTQETTELSINRLQQSLKHINQSSQHDYVIDFSYGVVEYHPTQHQSIEDLLAEGDSLMYQIKKSCP